jgi:hypothetical protein
VIQPAGAQADETSEIVSGGSEKWCERGRRPEQSASLNRLSRVALIFFLTDKPKNLS